MTFLEVSPAAAWIVFVVFWMWSARESKPRQARHGSTMARLFLLLRFVAVAVLFLPLPFYAGTWLDWSVFPHGVPILALGAALTVAGIAFACWARVHIGRNWSGEVDFKQGHELVMSGPYRFVRHPIYTGLLLAFVGTALSLGAVRGFVALAIVLITFWRKLQVEERWMTQHFGSAYETYKARTKALIPGIL
ncbi:putative protein-S-isoprenylcysteine methyltransferase [Hartmannibacter diazotrophicus]|uniref:Steroid 5-alpha reductase C-terminal domain-containing protein n=1 Tax=Hartmannibacter diazotrophicus TaxID=1482074 RepID=A0A2C9D553_9HYPH|nr:putative protein-S-isoprenylcysteine methyltransferase [Hartmannibacter diazotrophicus]